MNLSGTSGADEIASGTEKRARWELWLVLLAATAVLLVRKTDSFIHPQFWAEDGVVFFQDQVNVGFPAIFQPYGGYLHLAPRLIAWVTGVLFPYSLAPAVYNYLAVLVTLLVIINIYSLRFVAKNKALLALALVLVPHVTNEVFVSATNTNWFLAILLLVVLLKEPPDARFGNIWRQRISDWVAVICGGLSGPFIIYLAPFFVGRFFLRRKRYDFSLAALAVLIAVLQLVLVLQVKPMATGAPQADSLFTGFCRVAGWRLFGNLFLGSTWPYNLNPYVLCVGGMLVLASIFYLAVKTGNWRHVTVIMAISALLLASVFSKFIPDPDILLPPGNGPRYFYLPYVLWAWALILCLDRTKTPRNIYAAVLLCAILISSLVSEFHSPPLPDYHWQEECLKISKDKVVVIPVNPNGWPLVANPGHVAGN